MRLLRETGVPPPQNKRLARYAKLTSGLCEVVDDFGLVSFATLNVQARAPVGCAAAARFRLLSAQQPMQRVFVCSAPASNPTRSVDTERVVASLRRPQEEESMKRVVGIIDKANGYVFAGAIRKVRAGRASLAECALPPAYGGERD